MELSHLSQYTN